MTRRVFYWCSTDFITQNVSCAMQVSVGLIMLAACTVPVLNPGFLCFLLVIRAWDITSSIDPCFLLAEGLCKFYVNVRGKRQLVLVQYKHKANPLLSMNNYTLRVISRNDKNKQLTLLSQRKLALTATN
jgi:hypothetical protein